jgi:hypothetical protein
MDQDVPAPTVPPAGLHDASSLRAAALLSRRNRRKADQNSSAAGGSSRSLSGLSAKRQSRPNDADGDVNMTGEREEGEISEEEEAQASKDDSPPSKEDSEMIQYIDPPPLATPVPLNSAVGQLRMISDTFMESTTAPPPQTVLPEMPHTSTSSATSAIANSTEVPARQPLESFSSAIHQPVTVPTTLLSFTAGSHPSWLGHAPSSQQASAPPLSLLPSVPTQQPFVASSVNPPQMPHPPQVSAVASTGVPLPRDPQPARTMSQQAQPLPPQQPLAVSYSAPSNSSSVPVSQNPSTRVTRPPNGASAQAVASHPPVVAPSRQQSGALSHHAETTVTVGPVFVQSAASLRRQLDRESKVYSIMIQSLTCSSCR